VWSGAPPISSRVGPSQGGQGGRCAPGVGPIRLPWAGVAPPMRFTVDVGELAVVLALDTEPAEVDLTRAGLGDACLDTAVEGMLGSHRARSSPDGQAWAPLSAATVRRKGHPVRLDGELVRRAKVVGAGRGEAVGECLVASGSPQYGGAGRPGLSLFGVQQLGSFDSIFTDTVGNENFALFRMNINLENFTTY